MEHINNSFSNRNMCVTNSTYFFLQGFADKTNMGLSNALAGLCPNFCWGYKILLIPNIFSLFSFYRLFTTQPENNANAQPRHSPVFFRLF